jgi:hypothetical protein
MVAFAGAALWQTICACFAVSATIIGMPPQTITFTVRLASLNFGAIMGAISVAVLLRTPTNYDTDEPRRLTVATDEKEWRTRKDSNL